MNIRKDKSDYAPHDCTECGEPAYIPFAGPAQCTNWLCSRFDQKIWEEHVMSLDDTGDPVPEPMDIDEDAKTDPGFLLFPNILDD